MGDHPPDSGTKSGGKGLLLPPGDVLGKTRLVVKSQQNVPEFAMFVLDPERSCGGTESNEFGVDGTIRCTEFDNLKRLCIKEI
jgi:hypothetical protein